jgi:hypothetical protein
VLYVLENPSELTPIHKIHKEKVDSSFRINYEAVALED